MASAVVGAEGGDVAAGIASGGVLAAHLEDAGVRGAGGRRQEQRERGEEEAGARSHGLLLVGEANDGPPCAQRTATAGRLLFVPPLLRGSSSFLPTGLGGPAREAF